MLGFGLGVNRIGGGGGGDFNPASLFGGAQGAYYDPSDLASMWQDSARTVPAVVDQPVGAIDDRSGNGNHAVQATTAAKPILRQSGALYWLEFDGVDDKLTAVFTIAQTFDRVSGARFITIPVNFGRVFGGGNAVAGLLFAPTGTIAVFDGSVGPSATVPANGIDFVPTERHANASSRLALDNGAYVTTPASGASLPGGVSIGSDQGGTQLTNIRFYGMAMIQSALTDTQTSNLRTFFAAKQGRVL